MVERNLAKVKVAGPSPVFRSKKDDSFGSSFFRICPWKRWFLRTKFLKARVCPWKGWFLRTKFLKARVCPWKGLFSRTTSEKTRVVRGKGDFHVQVSDARATAAGSRGAGGRRRGKCRGDGHSRKVPARPDAAYQCNALADGQLRARRRSTREASHSLP